MQTKEAMILIQDNQTLSTPPHQRPMDVPANMSARQVSMSIRSSRPKPTPLLQGFCWIRLRKQFVTEWPAIVLDASQPVVCRHRPASAPLTTPFILTSLEPRTLSATGHLGSIERYN